MSSRLSATADRFIAVIKGGELLTYKTSSAPLNGGAAYDIVLQVPSPVRPGKRWLTVLAGFPERRHAFIEVNGECRPAEHTLVVVTIENGERVGLLGAELEHVALVRREDDLPCLLVR